MSSLTKSEFAGNNRVSSLLKKCCEARAHSTLVQKEDRNFSINKTRVPQSLALL